MNLFDIAACSPGSGEDLSRKQMPYGGQETSLEGKRKTSKTMHVKEIIILGKIKMFLLYFKLSTIPYHYIVFLQIADEYGVNIFETSTKANINVEEASILSMHACNNTIPDILVQTLW